MAATAFLKGGIATRNVAFNTLIDRIELVALRSTSPMLLTGPTGAGKSKLARRIWELKRPRRLITGPLVELNCATLRGDGAMSALFGHRRGAFTGAMADRPGGYGQGGRERLPAPRRYQSGPRRRRARGPLPSAPCSGSPDARNAL